jgi:anthranilate phosphoribosyltransferase
MLGPLVNPAQPTHQLTGVFSLELARLYQYIFQQLPNKSYAIVHALDGYDEVSLTGDFKLKMNHRETLISPQSIGKQILTQDSLFGGDTVEEAGVIFSNILKGSPTSAQRDAVTVNAGIAINCFKPDISLVDCIAEADESLMSGRALTCFERLISMN